MCGVKTIILHLKYILDAYMLLPQSIQTSTMYCHLKYIFNGKTILNFVHWGAMVCRGVIWLICIHFSAIVYLLPLVSTVINYGAMGCSNC